MCRNKKKKSTPLSPKVKLAIRILYYGKAVIKNNEVIPGTEASKIARLLRIEVTEVLDYLDAVWTQHARDKSTDPIRNPSKRLYYVQAHTKKMLGKSRKSAHDIFKEAGIEEVVPDSSIDESFQGASIDEEGSRRKPRSRKSPTPGSSRTRTWLKRFAGAFIVGTASTLGAKFGSWLGGVFGFALSSSILSAFGFLSDGDSSGM